MLPLRLRKRWTPTGHLVGGRPPPGVWDAYEAYIRRQYRTIISKVRKDNRVALEDAEKQAQILEASYATTREAGTYATLKKIHREILVLRDTAI